MGSKKGLAQKMQIEVIVKCMQSEFSGHASLVSESFCSFLFPFKKLMAKFPFQIMDYSPWGVKK